MATCELLWKTIENFAARHRIAGLGKPKTNFSFQKKCAALKLEIEFQSIPALNPNELAGALTAAAKDPPDALTKRR